MASMKISAMPHALQFFDADLVPIVQGGVNKYVHRSEFLIAPIGEEINAFAGGSALTIFSSGNVQATLASGKSFIVTVGAPSILTADSAGDAQLRAPNAHKTIIGDDPHSYIKVNSVGGAVVAGIEMHVDSAGSIKMTWGSTQVFAVASSGNMLWNCPPGAAFQLTVNGGFIVIDTGGLIDIENSDSSSVLVGYMPNNSSWWAGDPAYVNDALDRIAKVVSTLYGAPIP